MADKKLEYWESELEKAFEDVDMADHDAYTGRALAVFYRWLLSERKMKRSERDAKMVDFCSSKVMFTMETAVRLMRNLECPGEKVPDWPELPGQPD